MWHKKPENSVDSIERHRSDEWFRASFEFTPIGKALVTLSGQWLDVNPALCRLLGYSRAELLSRSLRDITHPEDLHLDLENAREMLVGSLSSYQIEKRYRHKQGHEVALLLSVSMAYDQQGQPLHFIVETQDITERKKTQQALVRSERRFHSIMEHVVDALIVHDRDGRMVDVNQSACDSLGYSREELLQMRVSDYALTYETAKVQAFWDAMVAGEIHDFCVEGIHQHKDGSTFPVEVRVSLMESDETPLMVAIARDVSERQRIQQTLEKANDELERRVLERTTELLQANEQLQVELSERKRTEEALREAQGMLRLVIDHIPEGIFWKDEQGIYMGCNQRLAQDAGLGSPQEIVGKTDEDMPWRANVAEVRQDDIAIMESGIPVLQREEKHTNTENVTGWVRSNKIPFQDAEGHTVGILGCYEDITLQKETEAALRQARDDAEHANRAKDEFLSRTSHELRTPLNAILGFAQILNMGELQPRQRESLGYILQAGEHLLELVNDLLDLERMVQGKQMLHLEPVPLIETLQEVHFITRLLAQQKGIEIECDLTRWPNLPVMADGQRLKQVLLNLISNAIKYNREGGRVLLSCEVLADQTVCINVCDTGLGIAPEQLKQLFTPFNRLGAEKTEVEGTGLGLTIAKALVEGMHGRLEVESEVGIGSTFSVVLPVAEEAASPKVLPVPSPHLFSRPPKTILYIEDNLSNLAVIQTLLEEQGQINLLSALQGSMGLELAQQYRPDLILLDMHLPDMRGDEVLYRLRDNALTGEIPVVILSADATSNSIERLLASGAKAYLTKPLDVKQFLSLIEQTLYNAAE